MLEPLFMVLLGKHRTVCLTPNYQDKGIVVLLNYRYLPLSADNYFLLLRHMKCEQPWPKLAHLGVQSGTWPQVRQNKNKMLLKQNPCKCSELISSFFFFSVTKAGIWSYRKCKWVRGIINVSRMHRSLVWAEHGWSEVHVLLWLDPCLLSWSKPFRKIKKHFCSSQ